MLLRSTYLEYIEYGNGTLIEESMLIHDSTKKKTLKILYLFIQYPNNMYFSLL